MAPRIRTATLDDAAAIAFIHNDAIASRRSTMETEPKTEERVRRWLDALGPRQSALVADEDGVVGWGLIKRYSDRPGYDPCGETSVFLHPEHLGRGIGTTLKRAVIEEARRLGYTNLLARIMSVNAASIAYNRRLGYREVGVLRRVGCLDGVWHDVTVMQLQL